MLPPEVEEVVSKLTRADAREITDLSTSFFEALRKVSWSASDKDKEILRATCYTCYPHLPEDFVLEGCLETIFYVNATRVPGELAWLAFQQRPAVRHLDQIVWCREKALQCTLFYWKDIRGSFATTEDREKWFYKLCAFLTSPTLVWSRVSANDWPELRVLNYLCYIKYTDTPLQCSTEDLTEIFTLHDLDFESLQTLLERLSEQDFEVLLRSIKITTLSQWIYRHRHRLWNKLTPGLGWVMFERLCIEVRDKRKLLVNTNNPATGRWDTFFHDVANSVATLHKIQYRLQSYQQRVEDTNGGALRIQTFRSICGKLQNDIRKVDEVVTLCLWAHQQSMVQSNVVDGLQDADEDHPLDEYRTTHSFLLAYRHHILSITQRSQEWFPELVDYTPTAYAGFPSSFTSRGHATHASDFHTFMKTYVVAYYWPRTLAETAYGMVTVVTGIIECAYRPGGLMKRVLQQHTRAVKKRKLCLQSQPSSSSSSSVSVSVSVSTSVSLSSSVSSSVSVSSSSSSSVSV